MYSSWTVPKLKRELIARRAKTHGRKEELIERLEAYDRNNDFLGEEVLMPECTVPNWPSGGFSQLTTSSLTPPVTESHIRTYLYLRCAADKTPQNNMKAIEKGALLLNSGRVAACSMLKLQEGVYFTGIVKAAMKKKVSYNFKLRVEATLGEVINSHCECPAGKGPHGTCKHIAAVLLMLAHFSTTKQLLVEKSCTEMLQKFHRPHQLYGGKPLTSEEMVPHKRNLMEDPRPLKYRKVPGYQELVRNHVTNYCSNTSKDLAIRYLFPRADLQSAVLDHDYLQLPFTEYWIDEAMKISTEEANSIQYLTKQQSLSRRWHQEREWRLTASRFGEVVSMTNRRNILKMCNSLYDPPELFTNAVVHGKQYESVAIRKFFHEHNLKVDEVGTYISTDYPYLAATPDGIIKENDCLVEVKCPYAARNCKIAAGPLFPFLTEVETQNGNSELQINQQHKYFAQVQGQLFVSKKRMCLFIVYTHADLKCIEVKICDEYCQNSLLPKLQLFYRKYWRPYLAEKL